MFITLNQKIQLQFFGSSHGEALGLVICGLPQGLDLNDNQISIDLYRRKAGKSLTSKRKEEDIPHVLSGSYSGYSTGEPLCVVFNNKDIRPQDYVDTKRFPRPSHADYPAFIKYGNTVDMSGGGPFSGRMTLGLVYAGAMLKQVLESKGIFVSSRLIQIGATRSCIDDADSPEEYIQRYKSITQKESQSYFLEDEKAFSNVVLGAQKEGDSVGARAQTVVFGLNPGFGGPLFEGLESKLAQVIFAIPGIKGVSFGKGFDLCSMYGLDSNDPIAFSKDQTVIHLSNNMGGIDGGMSNGMPLVIHSAIKPTPSIYKDQQTIDVVTKKNSTQRSIGRHDPCIALRANVVLEAACAAVIAAELI